MWFIQCKKKLLLINIGSKIEISEVQVDSKDLRGIIQVDHFFFLCNVLEERICGEWILEKEFEGEEIEEKVFCVVWYS